MSSITPRWHVAGSILALIPTDAANANGWRATHIIFQELVDFLHRNSKNKDI